MERQRRGVGFGEGGGGEAMVLVAVGPPGLHTVVGRIFGALGISEAFSFSPSFLYFFPARDNTKDCSFAVDT